jgi:predicted membrane-bound spermidine synthase
MILLLFFCSGATALVYEVIWSKYLSLMFGSTVQAQTVVLAVFMGGLALGNRLMGGFADRVRQPLLLYGCLEAAIGLYAFFFEPLFHLADALFVFFGSRWLPHSGLLLLKGGLSVGLLLGPTVLMGCTLPLLAAWLQGSTRDAGRWSARFYSTNSLGAVCGSWLAGFYLVQSWGMVAALQLTALANVIIGFIVIGLARRGAVSPAAPTPSPTAVAGSVPAPTKGVPLLWMGLLVFLTGGVSMGLEVLASRSLALLFGSSLQAFTIMLMAFIFGIGAGSAVIATPRIRRWQPERTLFFVLLSAAVWVAGSVMAIEAWVEAYRWALTGLARTEMGFTYFQVLSAIVSMMVLGFPAALIGSVLPLCMRWAAEDTVTLGQQIGRLLTWNTLGAVTGAILAGFVLMPTIGLRGAFAVFALVLWGAALITAVAGRLHLAAIMGGVLGLGLACGISATGESWRQVLSSGVFRFRETVVHKKFMAERKKTVELLYYRDAADATVSVERNVSSNQTHDLCLRINGKPDASVYGDLSTQYLLAHLPMLVRPDSREAFVLGLGSGITAGALLGHPLQRITVAENCRPVIEAAQLFDPWNRGVLTNARVRLWEEDARTILKLNSETYDLIISEPSNPWTAGIGSVFSRDFYELAARRLKPDGMMVQWFHIYEINDEIVSMVLRTFGSVFPYLEIWDAQPGDIILLGAQSPWPSTPDIYRRGFEREGPREDLRRIGLHSPEAVWARQLASQRTAHAIAGSGPEQSDAFPVLEYEAPRAFFIGASALQLLQYDERTWQSALATPARRQASSRLSVTDLRTAFGSYGSVNGELNQYLAYRYQTELTEGQPETQHALRAVPNLFRPASSRSDRPAPPPGLNEKFARLWRAHVQLAAETDPWQSGVDEILAVMTELAAGTVPVDPSLAAYASLAIRTCFAHDDLDRAGKLVFLGRQLLPEHAPFGYYARILEREVRRP